MHGGCVWNCARWRLFGASGLLIVTYLENKWNSPCAALHEGAGFNSLCETIRVRALIPCARLHVQERGENLVYILCKQDHILY